MRTKVKLPFLLESEKKGEFSLVFLSQITPSSILPVFHPFLHGKPYQPHATP